MASKRERMLATARRFNGTTRRRSPSAALPKMHLPASGKMDVVASQTCRMKGHKLVQFQEQTQNAMILHSVFPSTPTAWPVTRCEQCGATLAEIRGEV
jgi:hypothetical protein